MQNIKEGDGGDGRSTSVQVQMRVVPLRDAPQSTFTMFPFGGDSIEPSHSNNLIRRIIEAPHTVQTSTP